jgi:hypothetical protein
MMTARDRRWPEVVTVRLPARTLGRISAALRPGEDGAAAFVREAIVRELETRERDRRNERLATWIA